VQAQIQRNEIRQQMPGPNAAPRFRCARPGLRPKNEMAGENRGHAASNHGTAA